MNTANETQRFSLSASGESLMLGIPLIFIALSVIDYLITLEVTPMSHHLVHFLIASLLMNTIHFGFSFFSLANSVELRNVCIARFGSIKKMLTKLSMLWIVSFIPLLFVYDRISLGTGSPLIPFLIFTSFHTVVASWHSIHQSKGIYLCYNHLPGPNNSKPMPSSDRWALTFLCSSIYCFLLTDIAAELFSVEALLEPLSWAFIASGWLSFAYLTAAVVRRKQFNKYQLIFSSRFLLWLLLPFSSFPSFGVRAVHGTEYYFVTEKIVKKSKSFGEFRWLKISSLFLIIGVIHALISYKTGFPRLIYPTHNSVPLVYNILSAAGISFTYLHFYLDSVFFSFKRPYVAANVAPLLGNQHLSTAAEVSSTALPHVLSRSS